MRLERRLPHQHNRSYAIALPASGSATATGRTGIFCGNDQIARGVIDVLRERGVRVPQDISVIGFDHG
ncbi:substrate-binding domain-containing protein [Shinella sp. S4-D37]|uniref:substrate-binding domain-containing protein n=1 Tax=Shinella sp. S4-D37 TaxID=3161999 RepID=UPI003467ADC3